MNWGELRLQQTCSFCQDQNGFVGRVVDILSRYLYSDSIRDVLQTRYARMRDNFRSVSYDASNWDQNELTNDLDSEADRDAAVLDVPERCFTPNTAIGDLVHTYYNCGTDLPVWIDNGNSAFKVMIIGQDPMRNKHRKRGHLYLSSPWGLHSASFTKCGKTKNVLARLIKDYRASVYITDFSKLYFTDYPMIGEHTIACPCFPRRVAEVNRRWNCDGLFASILAEEKRLFEPDLVMFMGKDVLAHVGLNWRDDDPFMDDWQEDEVFGRYVTVYHPNARVQGYEYFDNAFRAIAQRINTCKKGGAK